MAIKPYKGCIYLATNTVNGSIYIGKSLMGMHRRRKTHFAGVRAGHTYPFSCALRKYGEHSFEWVEIYLSNDHKLLMAAEIALIASYAEAGYRLYNATKGGDGSSRKRRPEEVEAIKARGFSALFIAKCNARWTPEERQKQAERMRNRVVSPESIKKTADAKRGKKRDPELVERIAAAHRGKSLPPWTLERRAKMEAAWARKALSRQKEP